MRPPRALGLAVGCVAAATLLTEITLTRVFSVLYYYHFSFFAVALAMSGLALGGLVAARWPARSLAAAVFGRRLGDLAIGGAVIGLIDLALFALLPRTAGSAPGVVAGALQWLPLFVASGAFLGLAFARRPEWIGSLYAWDLVFAGAACIVAIPLLRFIPGPAALCAIPLLLGLAAAAIEPAGRARRVAGGSIAGACAATLLLAIAERPQPLIQLRDEPPGVEVLFERWNEYSRIQGRRWPAAPDEIDLVIDRSASTQMPRVRGAPGGGPPRPTPEWSQGTQALVYRLGRRIDRVAIIGVGGGRDFLPPLAHGAREIVGYEYNRIFIDLLDGEYGRFNTAVRRPEVRLVHAEGRDALRRERGHFDVVQASLTDTWAATAGGGFVLVESGLYTLEGWATLLGALTPNGILTMTRWYLPGAPTEAQRLATLAAEALSRDGISDARGHIALLTGPAPTPLVDPVFGPVLHATIIVSRVPFSPAEEERLRRLATRNGFSLVADPGAGSTDSTIAAVMRPDGRAQVIARHPYDISPPTDLRPYFFLQLRANDLSRLLSRAPDGPVDEINLHAVRVLVAFAIAALCLTGVVVLLARGWSETHLRTPALLRGYFTALGLGYMLVQLGLHQRLTLVLGHPTYSLAVVLFSMLVGTGIGAWASQGLDERSEAGWLILMAGPALAVAAFELVPRLEALGLPVRLVVVGLLVLAVGMALGLGFPLGVRLAAPLGDRVVQRMWAINGAASIAGSALAALVGLTAGSRATVAAGLLCYLGAVVTGASSRHAAIFKR